MKLIEGVIVPAWERAGLDRFYLIYVGIIIGAALGWFTGLNAFPVFSLEPTIGRVLTCLAMGCGPSFLWDLIDKQPKP